MQIKRVKIHNYKTYVDLNLDLSVDPDRPIILFGGQNGGGKTTFFEAICGTLYGLQIKNSKRFNELLNDGSKGKIEPKIELELTFTGQVLSETQTYLLRRTYMLNPEGKPVESVYLNMNGSTFVYGTATPTAQRAKSEQQVNKIIKANLPEELSKYFLFDAMQSSQLLEDSVFAQIIRDNIENVMGFKKYLQIKEAAEKLQQEKSKERLQAAKEKEEYEALCEEKIKKQGYLTKNIEQQEDINKYLISMRDAYKKAKEGEEDETATAQKIATLEAQIDSTTKEAKTYSEDIKAYLENIESESFLPKVSQELEPELTEILRNKEDSKKSKESLISLEDIQDITTKVVNYLKDCAMCTSDVEIDAVSKYVMSLQKSKEIGDNFAFLDETEVDALKNLLHHRSVNRFVQLLRNKQKLDIEIAEIPTLKVQLDTYKKQLKGSSTVIIKDYEVQQAELAQLKKDEEELKATIQRLDKNIHSFDVQIQQEPDVKYDTLVKLKPFFEEVADTLLQAKKAQIEREMTQQLNILLLSYKDCIDRVELSDRLDDFSIKMYHKAGNEISLTQLNAASKQIFIQVMLKVLRNLGDYNPPVMIDTVMGVLDEESREALMEEYFPMLAEQTILLCTTSEIRKNSDYLKLEPFISKTYTLIRHPETQSTTVEENYFGITLKD